MRARMLIGVSCLALAGCDFPQANLPNPPPPAAPPLQPPPLQPPPVQPPGVLPSQPSQFPSTPPVVSGLDTPQAAMQRYETAKNKRDFKTQAQCLTPETLQAFAAMQISDGTSYAAVGQVPRALERRGITLEMLKKLNDTPAEGRKEAIRALAASMTDLAGLFAEVMSASRPLGPPPPSTITSVNIQGDRATANVAVTGLGSVQVELRKYADGWKVDDSRYYSAY